MQRYDYDLFTIGGGSAGVRGSRFAAGFGARVAVAEERAFGGTCVNVGCIPKKLLAYAAHYRHDFDNARGFGWRAGEPAFDWPTLRANKDKEIARLNAVYERVLASAGVAIHRGRANLLDPHTVEVDGKRYSAAHIMVATGGWPSVPAIPGAEHAITSNEAFHLESLPPRAIVVGGGYIAVEFASIWCGLGVDTTLIYRGERLLKEFDHDLGAFLAEQMAKKGVRLVFKKNIVRIDRHDALHCQLDDGEALEADLVLYATGRTPNTRGFGLEHAGVALRPTGAVIVDDQFQTKVPSIYAVGDCIDRMQLTPVALAEGMVVADRLFNKGTRAMDYDNVPTAIFSDPNVGTVGLSEAHARAKYERVAIYRSTFTPLKHQLTGSGEKMLMKLVVDQASDRVLGVHMVGSEAGEIIQGFAVALKCGATKRQFDSTIGIHPTAAEEFVTMREAVS